MGKKKKSKALWGILMIILLVIFACLCYWKRRGIRNTFYRMAGIEIPFEIKEREQQKKYGYYKQEVKVSVDLDETVSINENDGAADGYDTDITKEDSLVKTSYDIDAQVDAELASGNYSFEEPLVILNPYRISPLTGLILFTTEDETAVRVTVKGKTEAADITGEVEASVSHRIPLVGLYPSMENTVILELLDGSGNVTKTQELKVQTSGLPEALNDIVKPVKTSGTSAFGLTVVYGQQCHYPFAYDCNGDVRWFFEKETANYGMYNLSNGRLIFQDTGAYTPSQQKPQSTNLYEIDYLGRAVRMYYLPNGSHHEVIEKEPGGNLLALTSSLKGQYEEEIVEIDRETGEIVNELELADVFGSAFINKSDWAHINTVSYQADQDTILISARNLHSVIKLNWTTHEIVWILCSPEFYEGTDFEQYVLTPEGDFTWHFQQHSSYQLTADLDNDPDTVEISLFDNHYTASRKVDYFDGLEESHVMVYSVDEKAKTVKQIKKLAVIYSKITSNTIYDEESGHIFGMCGWVVYPDDGRRGMTYEFDYETGELLNQYSIKNKFYRATEMKINWNDLASAMAPEENYIKGSLKPAVETQKTVKTPEETLESGVSFKLVGSVLYVDTLDHHISQIIFKGENHTYVYDSTDIRLHTKDYLAHEGNIPVPLGNMEPDTYEILCVYQDVFCQTGHSFTKR